MEFNKCKKCGKTIDVGDKCTLCLRKYLIDLNCNICIVCPTCREKEQNQKP